MIASFSSLGVSEPAWKSAHLAKLGTSPCWSREANSCTPTTQVSSKIFSNNSIFLIATHPFVALAGRVPCKVIGKVVKGDRIVSSSTPGTAIADKGDNPDYRPIIGRALESKDTEEPGTVEVVVGAK